MSGSVRVITYEDAYDIPQLVELQNYKDAPHICATLSLAAGVQKLNCFSNVTTAKTVIDGFYPGWNNVENRFNQFAKLGDCLRNMEGNMNDKILESFKRNKLDLLITMRNLTEVGLTPDEVKQKAHKIEEKLFCLLWEKMVPIFKPYINRFKEKISEYSSVVSDVFGELSVPLNDKVIILHGFYYISPVQHYLFTELKSQGVDLIFLNLYNESYPHIFSFLDENFSENHGWINKEQWEITHQHKISGADYFANVFEGKSSSNDVLRDMSTKSYDYMSDFIDDLDFKNHHYVATDHEELEVRIKEYYPEAFKDDRHLLSYPIGQYLLHLHSIWNEDRQEYYLTDRTLMECFSSGWLEKDGQNGKMYLNQLKAILPYFTKCETIDDWENRLDALISAKDALSNPLRAHMQQYGLDEHESFKAVRLTPMLRFSFFTVPMKQLKIIRELIKKLIDNTKWLVNITEERVSIKKHFERIQTLMEESNIKTTFLETEEYNLVIQLEKLLSNPSLGNEEYHVSDIADALVVFLKNGLKNQDEEDSKVENSQDTNEISKIEDLDGIILRNQDKDLHLCGIDEMHFPAMNAPMPWPLSLGLLKDLKHTATNMYIFREEHQLDFVKYLFYNALSFEGEVTFSWIKNWNGYEHLDKSIYVELLDLDKKQPHQNGLSVDSDFRYIEKDSVVTDTQKSTVLSKLSKFPNEEFIEMNLCKRRFYYSNILSKFSSYHSNFHQVFLIGNLVKIYASIGKNKREIIDILEDVFPNQSNFRIQAIVEENMSDEYVFNMRKYGLSKKATYEDIEYPAALSYFQFLTHKGAFQNELWKTSFKYMDANVKMKSNLASGLVDHKDILPTPTPSSLCKLCPHNSYCEAAMYPVDLSHKGFDDIDAN